MTHFWPDYTALIAELRAEATASEELHPEDSCIEVMRRAADALEAERRVRKEEHAIAKHLRVEAIAAMERAERELDLLEKQFRITAKDSANAGDRCIALEASLHEALSRAERAEANEVRLTDLAKTLLARAERLTAALSLIARQKLLEEYGDGETQGDYEFAYAEMVRTARYTLSPTTEPAKAEEP